MSKKPNCWSRKPNFAVKETQLPVKEIQLPVKKTKLMVKKTQLPVKEPQHYNFLTEIVWKNVGGLKLIHYLCQRYKHIIHLSV